MKRDDKIRVSNDHKCKYFEGSWSLHAESQDYFLQIAKETAAIVQCVNCFIEIARRSALFHENHDYDSQQQTAEKEQAKAFEVFEICEKMSGKAFAIQKWCPIDYMMIQCG